MRVQARRVRTPMKEKPATLSQRVDRHSVNATINFTNLRAWAVQRIARPEWIPVEAQEESPAATTPFEAVKHEHAALNRPSVAREDDLAMKPEGTTSTGERYHSSQSRLLAFKKPR